MSFTKSLSCPLSVFWSSPVCVSHRRIGISQPHAQVASVFPSGLNTISIPISISVSSSVNSVRLSVLWRVPVSTSHSRMVLSELPLARVLPSALNTPLKTSFVCPLSVFWSSPVCASHIRTVLSLPPLASKVPSALNTTFDPVPVYPVSVLWSMRVCTCHRQMVLSEFPLASVFPSGLNVTVRTQFV